ncbi:MAG: hypothetical protein ABIT38_19610 [Gemmatimonadaceae bacterium]
MIQDATLEYDETPVRKRTGVSLPNVDFVLPNAATYATSPAISWCATV